MDYSRQFQALVVDPTGVVTEPLRGIFGLQQPAHSGLVDDGSALACSHQTVATSQAKSPASTLIRNQVALQSARCSTTVAEQISMRAESGREIDLLFYHFDLSSHRAAVWELQSLASTYPNLDVIVCANTDDPRWEDAGQRIEGEENLLVVRTPLEAVEVRQLILLLLRKRQLRNHLGRVCQERELHVENRTRHLSSALEESRRLLSAIDLSLIEIDSENIVRRWNHEAERQFGLSQKQAVGRKFEQLEIAWNNPSEVCQFLRSSTAPESRTLEASFQIKDNVAVVLNLTRHTIHHPDQPNGVLALGVDLTEQRHLQQHLQQAQRLESVGQLAAGVAHEINTPMQYIGDNIDFLSAKFGALIPYLEGSLRLLQEGEELPEPERIALRDHLLEISKKLKLTRLIGQVPDAFSDSQQGLHHVTRIVRAMKELSHPGGTERTAVDVNHLLETAMTVSTNEWKYVADFSLDLTPENTEVPGFPGELSQVFLNLIINAGHAIADENERLGRQKGRIEVISQTDDSDVVVKIQDNGSGIPLEIRDRIFDPFFTTKDVGKGTGQGLAIAHSVVVKKHGGRIEVQSVPNGGTRFVISLPVVRPTDHDGVGL